jgi:hypothetical protein
MRLNDPMHPSPHDHPGRSVGAVWRQLRATAVCIACLTGQPAAFAAEAMLSAGPATDVPEGPAVAYYRWIDSQGRVQYTDFEPVGVPAQRIPLAPPASDDAPAIASAGADWQPDPFYDQDAQILPIGHIGPCADARQQLAVLYASVPVYRDDRGQYRTAWRGDTYRGDRDWLDADDRTSAITRARDAVLAHCSDPTAFEQEVQAFESEVGRH